MSFPGVMLCREAGPPQRLDIFTGAGRRRASSRTRRLESLEDGALVSQIGRRPSNCSPGVVKRGEGLKKRRRPLRRWSSRCRALRR